MSSQPGKPEDKIENKNLETSRKDLIAAFARGVASAVPFAGGLIAEVIDQIIPKQRIDRLVDYLKLLDDALRRLNADLQMVKDRLYKNEGLDLFEEGVLQASRSISEERRRRLANLLAKSLSQEELKYAESKKLLNLLRELTDPEVLILLYYSEQPTFGSEYHKQLSSKHPDILQPVSRSFGVSQEEIDKGSLQDSYKNTLIRMGLLQEKVRSISITSLGKLLLRYIEKIENNNEPNDLNAQDSNRITTR